MSLAMPMVAVGSPTRQSFGPPFPGFGANSLSSSPNLNKSGGIRKRSSTTTANTLSTVCPERLYQAALDIADFKESSAIPAAAGFQWITPQHSPQPDTIFDEPSILDSFPLWSAPTPPHSDSGLPPPLSLDAHDTLITTSGIDLSNHFTFDQPTADMSSSLGFLLPSAYGSGGDDDDYSNESSYQIPPVRLSQSTTSSGTAAYAQAGSSSPSHYASRPNASASRSAPSIPPMNHSPLPSPHPGGPSYSSTSAAARSLFDSNMHPPHSSHYAASYHAGQQPPSQYSPSNPSDILHKPSSSEANARAMSARPKPQCWEHGCNGRQFSTFSNLLRHQREKSGTSSKSSCPKCGAEFTRTTARNGHLAHDKCTKTPRPGDEDK